MNSDRLLQEAIACGIINVQDVKANIEMKKREEILNKHNHKIWKSGDYWYTYLDDITKKKRRRQIRRQDKNKLESAIINYYNEINDIPDENAYKFKDLYKDWINFKSLHTNSSAYIRRINSEWERFFSKDPIAEVPLKKFTTLYLDEWIHDCIQKNSLTKKQYYNMSLILRQGLDYAVSIRAIDINPFLQVQVNKRMLVKTPKKNDTSQVFTVEEEPKILNLALSRFEKDKTCTAPLGVILAFKTGLRVGELAALRVSDIHENYIRIHAMEICEYKKTEQGYSVSDRAVVDYTKTDAGERNVYLTLEARKLIKMITYANKMNGNWQNEFLFVDKNGERFHYYAFSNRLRNYCKTLDVPAKSMHKIRKTYISSLIDEHINLNKIRELVGHTDERTTLGSYCFNRYTEDQTATQIEKALSR